MRGFIFSLVLAAMTCADLRPTWAQEPEPPLPNHSFEGVGGAALTPLAYLVNPGPEDAIFGRPAVAFTYANLGHKNLDAFTVTETLFRRIEVGYAANRLGLGNLRNDVRNITGLDIGRNDFWLHHFNVRVLLVEEDTTLAGVPLPAVTAGIHFKVNDGVREVNRRTGGALSMIGYHRENGEDITITATKLLPTELTVMPVVLTAGLRESQAAHVGFFGFGHQYHATFEGSVVVFPAEWLLFVYEFRQKPDPYGQLPGIYGNEDHWHGFTGSLILNEHSTISAGYGMFGTVANAETNSVWWLQMKYEF